MVKRSRSKFFYLISGLYCVLIISGCGAPAVVIHKTAVKPPQIKDTLKAEKELKLIKNGEMQHFEEFYQAVKLNKNKDTAAVVRFYPDKMKFDYEINPDTVILYDTIKLKSEPLIIKGKNNTEKAIWIIGTVVINIVIWIFRKRKKKKNAKTKFKYRN